MNEFLGGASGYFQDFLFNLLSHIYHLCRSAGAVYNLLLVFFYKYITPPELILFVSKSFYKFEQSFRKVSYQYYRYIFFVSYDKDKQPTITCILGYRAYLR
jgi:hypothetical protein